MLKGMTIACMCLCGLASECVADDVTFMSEEKLEKSVRDGWSHVMSAFYYPGTSMIYTAPPEQVTKARHFRGGFLYPEDGMGYGHGIGDCAIINGVALSMLVDQYAVTGEKAVLEDARKIYLGLCNLATAHGVPGFVARGLCVEDGKSCCVLSSRDQVTHFIHGLWRYYRSPMSDASSRKEIGELFKAVSDRMRRNVIPENDYDFLRADGSRDTRGICRMMKVLPHEAARLPMVYLATYDVTGDMTYKKYYDECIAEAVECSLKLKEKSEESIRGIMPCYTLLQMISSFEVLLGSGKDPERAAVFLEAMQPAAKMGAVRAVRLQGKDEKYLCASGETLLAQLMTPGYPFPEEQHQLLRLSLQKPLLPDASCCRAVHLAAAYWRWRVNQLKK